MRSPERPTRKRYHRGRRRRQKALLWLWVKTCHPVVAPGDELFQERHLDVAFALFCPRAPSEEAAAVRGIDGARRLSVEQKAPLAAWIQRRDRAPQRARVRVQPLLDDIGGGAHLHDPAEV